MIQFMALMHRQVIESRWVVIIMCALLFAFGALNTYGTKNYQNLVDQGDLESAAKRYGHLRFLGGIDMDWSTIATEVCWWNHPLVVLSIVGWALVRGSNAIAGEIERGTVDVTLSRPISRTTYLLNQVAFMALGLLALVAALLAGTVLGNFFFATASPPSLFDLMKPAAIVVALGLSIYGYTVLFSAMDVVRWRASIIAAAITICGLVFMTTARQYEGWEWMEKLSVFWLYRPVSLAVGKEPLLADVAILFSIFLGGVLAAWGLTLQRDFPSNS